MEKTVLAYIKKNNQYLMLFRNKKQKDINKGKWIGIGGHIEKNETIIDALYREIKEETNLDVKSYKYKGIVYFFNHDYEEEMHLFVVDEFEGELKECDEGTLKYIDIDKVTSLNIWEGDKIFLPLLIKDEPFFKLKLYYRDDKLIKVDKE